MEILKTQLDMVLRNLLSCQKADPALSVASDQLTS